jgi:hypothetical protein
MIDKIIFNDIFYGKCINRYEKYTEAGMDGRLRP